MFDKQTSKRLNLRRCVAFSLEQSGSGLFGCCNCWLTLEEIMSMYNSIKCKSTAAAKPPVKKGLYKVHRLSLSGRCLSLPRGQH